MPGSIWRTRDDMTINVALGSGGKAQQFAQTMAIANVQKQLIAGGKTNLVGDRELLQHRRRADAHHGPQESGPVLQRSHRGQSADRAASEPAAGAAIAAARPKLLVAQAKAQSDQAIAAHQAQIQQQKAQNDAIHVQVKTQGEIELARIKADLDAKMALLETHLKAAIEAGKVQRSYPPGARKAKDGHHYVPDAKRPGKYLQVIHHV